MPVNAEAPKAQPESAAHTIPIVGPLDHSVDDADRAVATGQSVDLDFAGCTFLSVEGLEWLEELMLRSESVGSRVRFVNIPPTIYKVFKVAHIGSLLKASGAPVVRGPVC